MRLSLTILLLISSLNVSVFAKSQIHNEIQKDYDNYLKSLFIHFHKHPELSMGEVNTAARIAKELNGLGFTVHEGIGETGIVAILENGKGPTVMMRADMDGLPLKRPFILV
jgi:metal-dependent amidase/aminoacylase/carboxypeptidase family protein